MKHRHRAWAATAAVWAALISLTGTGCGRSTATVDTEHLQVVATHPHERDAFTEGLEVDGNVRYESTGMLVASTVRATDATTGRELARVALPPDMFGEGLTLAGSTLWQLTWQSGVAFDRDPVTLAERRRVHFDGEGWGLCFRDGRLLMSNGTDTLTYRDPVTFAVTGTVRLTSHNNVQLNELDCSADGTVYANTWPSDHILRLDPATGRVLADIDAAGLLSITEKAGADVLNGIAQIPGTDRYLITGKYWPTLFEVRFVPGS
ncbi:glutaminyl-peptide cyclotransferase [Nocardia stercoris]|uniref:Glutaminyl-peptide cyclotransferase n=1 Tax=Nocardia stercoris TaxID=2483361 RepID=A0A3M2L551_9NOCA|nr:glutaminyl-peptide cyclotransferase [Nocardia stercoris]RMI29658.1 glutaminyl-peptide cyclotransferase [Nocardia stercoris]